MSAKKSKITLKSQTVFNAQTCKILLSLQDHGNSCKMLPKIKNCIQKSWTFQTLLAKL